MKNAKKHRSTIVAFAKRIEDRTLAQLESIIFFHWIKLRVRFFFAFVSGNMLYHKDHII